VSAYEALTELREALYSQGDTISKDIAEIKRRLDALEKRIDDLAKQIPTRMATERQKEFINDICKTLNIPYPDGFPNHMTFQQASEFIQQKSRFFYDAKRSQAGGARA